MEKELRLRYISFRLLVVVGLLLGLLLLVQTFVTYYNVLSSLIVSELRREARTHVISLESAARRLDIQDPVELSQVIADMRQAEPNKIAWIRVVDIAGQMLVQNGNASGPPLTSESLRLALEQGAPVAYQGETKAGRVLVVVLPVRLEGGIAISAVPSTGPRFVEMALYWESATEAYRALRSNLIVSCAAAFGLVVSMVLMWSRFPHYIRGKQLEQQTELARQVQIDLLPAANYAIENLDFAADCEPAWRVGGDFYDVFSSPQGRIAIVLGDVSGDGLPASVVVGLLIGAVRASSWMGGSAEHEASSRELNGLLLARTALDRFASMFWCYYEPGMHLLRYVNAGHPPPMLVKRNSSGGLEIQRLQEGGPVLGLLPAAEYHQGQASIDEGDLLVLYSDGVVEAANAFQEQFGEERLLAAICENSEKASAEIRDEILKRVRLFLGAEPSHDDLTLLVAKVQNGHARIAT